MEVSDTFVFSPDGGAGLDDAVLQVVLTLMIMR